MLQKHLLQHLY